MLRNGHMESLQQFVENERERKSSGVDTLMGEIGELRLEIKRLKDRLDASPPKASLPFGLRTADEMSRRFGITRERLCELCESRFAPHYLLDGSKEPYFKVDEFKAWFQDNCLMANGGMAIPKRATLFDFVPRQTVVPNQLSNLDGILELPVDQSISGIYFLCKNGEVVYVGKSTNVISRVATHSSENRKDFDKVFFLTVPKSELAALEKHYATILRPKYNVDENGRVFW
jgi:hypothetical protein